MRGFELGSWRWQLALEAELMSLAAGLGDQHNDLYIGSINYLHEYVLFIFTLIMCI